MEKAFSGFSNTGLLAVAGLRQTGALGVVIKHFFGRPRTPAVAQFRMMAPGLHVASLNNTPIVTTFMPAVLDWAWANRLRISPSKLLIPLSYAAITAARARLSAPTRISLKEG